MSQGTLPAFQRSVGNQEVMRMLAISRQAAAPATAQQRPPAAAFDQERAVGYNQGRFTYDQSLVDQLNQVAGNRELYEAVTRSREVGSAFAQLVYAAQQVLFPSAANDGMLGVGTLRAVRQRTGRASTEVGLAANGRPIPERQVYSSSPNDPARERTFTTARIGGFVVTGGYMEPDGHSMKRGIRAIRSQNPNRIEPLADSKRNLGIDYVVQNPGKEVKAWYGGLVTFAGHRGGYGNRVIIETDVTYVFNGTEYPVVQAYAHNWRLHVTRGTVIEPGARIATMGGTGKNRRNDDYPEHVDLRTWITVDGRQVDVSPNLLDQQIAARRRNAGPQAGTRQPGSGQTRTNGQAAPQRGNAAPTRPRVAERPAAHPRPSAPARTPARNPIGTATVTADVLNVRQGPARNTARIGRLQRLQTVQVLARQGEWLQIRYGNSTAFIHGGYTTFRPAPAQQQPRQEESLLDQAGDLLQQGRNSIGGMVDSAVDTARGWFGLDEQSQTQSRPQQAPAQSNGSRSGTRSRNPNAILSQLTTTGASQASADSDNLDYAGVRASERMAQTDARLLRQYIQMFIDVGAETGLPPALLAAIASRESRGGGALDRNGYGDDGNGYGLMQVDKNAHPILHGGPRSREHVEQAAVILKDDLVRVRRKFPRWSAAQQLRGAVAAYNFGIENVRSWEGLDRGTTKNDYSADVWARARYYASLPEFSNGADLVTAQP